MLCGLVPSLADTHARTRHSSRGDLPIGTVVSRSHEHEHVLMFSHKLVHTLCSTLVIFHASIPVGR